MGYPLRTERRESGPGAPQSPRPPPPPPTPPPPRVASPNRPPPRRCPSTRPRRSSYGPRPNFPSALTSRRYAERARKGGLVKGSVALADGGGNYHTQHASAHLPLTLLPPPPPRIHSLHSRHTNTHTHTRAPSPTQHTGQSSPAHARPQLPQHLQAAPEGDRVPDHGGTGAAHVVRPLRGDHHAALGAVPPAPNDAALHPPPLRPLRRERRRRARLRRVPPHARLPLPRPPRGTPPLRLQLYRR